MSQVSNIELNHERLDTLLSKLPGATHVNMRRAEGDSVDIPLSQADTAIRQHVDWNVESVSYFDGAMHTADLESISGGVPTDTPLRVTAVEEPALELPPRPSEEIPDDPTVIQTARAKIVVIPPRTSKKKAK